MNSERVIKTIIKSIPLVIEFLSTAHIVEYFDPQVLSLMLPHSVNDTDREGKGVRCLTQGNPYRSLSTLPIRIIAYKFGIEIRASAIGHLQGTMVTSNQFTCGVESHSKTAAMAIVLINPS